MREKKNFDVQSSTSRTTCNKDTTGLVTLNTFSRGHMFYVSSGGIIRYYSPLYKSEGTAQVSIHTIKYLELYIKEYENIDDAFLFYDNMVKIIICIRRGWGDAALRAGGRRGLLDRRAHRGAWRGRCGLAGLR